MSEDIPQEDKDIKSTLIEEEMKKSYVTYAMSVIVSRALPDVRDGLKPVHRRVLYGMENLSLFPGKPFKKSARIVGDVIGKYHPHGDTAVYHTLVRMAQDFSMRYPLINGQGNFGSVDGDSPAAMRYTEARMERFAEMMLENLDKETVDFAPNYDDSLTEPKVLPSAFPNLLVNGSTGIAVGMATNLPPHNLREIVSACVALIKDPNLSETDMLNYVQGPDFPTGGIIQGRTGIRQAYLQGRGRIKLRAQAEIEEGDNNRSRIIIREIPYQLNKSSLIEKIAQLVKDKIIEGISDIRDESDRKGMRIVVDLKRDCIPDVVLNQLFRYSQLESTFSIINLALVAGRPKILTLREMVQHYIDHRHEILLRVTQFDLKKAKERSHILEGLRTALQNLDAVIAIIRKSSTTSEAREKLQEKFNLSEKQSEAIVEMRLRSLTGLEIEKIEKEYRELTEKIIDLEDILARRERRMDILTQELETLSQKYGDNRRTEIVDVEEEVTDLDLIPNEPMVVTVSHAGYIKRVPVEVYRVQGRGGKGITGATLKDDEDFVEHLFVGWSHSYILIFTNLGRCHWLRVFSIPEGGRTARGKALINLVQLQPGEKVSAFVPVKSFEEQFSIVLATAKGTINKMALEDFSRPRSSGINAINLVEGDSLIRVVLASEDQDVMIGSHQGQAIRFTMSKFRQMGRNTKGVRGIRLGEGDEVIGMVVIKNGYSILTLTENGYGKRTDPDEYRLTNRGGKGVRNIKITAKNGKAVAIAAVKEDQGLMVLTRQGIIIKIRIDSISTLGRDTQGVRIIRLSSGDEVADVEILDADEVEMAGDEMETASEGAAQVQQEPPEPEEVEYKDEKGEEDSSTDELE